MSKKQTATEWLSIQLYEKMKMSGDGKIFDDILKQAKAIEKEQIVDAFYEGMCLANFDPNKGRGVEYYKTTYNYE